MIKLKLVLLVADGSQQNIAEVGDTASPTVNPISVNVALNYAASNKHYLISAHDCKHAFLLPAVEHDKQIYVRVNKDIVDRWIRKYPYRKEFVTKSGAMYCKLDHYLYGLQEASRCFHTYLDKHLKKLDFTPTKPDPCLYTKQTSDGLMFVTTHVDDILLLAPNLKQQSIFIKEFSKQFELVSQFNKVSYLGMTIQRLKNGNISVTQEGYINDILKKHKCDNLLKYPPTPASNSLFETDTKSAICDKHDYLSLTMQLMYLARFTRPDILMPVTYLATKSSKPTQNDHSKLLRIVRYLAGTSTIGIVFTPSNMEPYFYSDASHAIHYDGRGHGGITATFGLNNSPFLNVSYKLKSQTRSSSESELVTAEEATTYIIWLRCLLQSFHITLNNPTTLFQDNKSTIIISSQGGSFKRTKHLICKDNFIKEHIENGVVQLQYMSTNNMPADMLTKPLSRTLLEFHMQTLQMQKL
jgi:hypothetical protein